MGYPRVMLSGAVLCVLLLNGSVFAQISSSWLNPVDGNWIDAANWSTNPDAPNNDSPNPGDVYDVTIDATGAPYQATLDTDVTLRNLTLNSLDATLWQTSNLVIQDTFAVDSGTYRLHSGSLTGGTLMVNSAAIAQIHRAVVTDVVMAGEFQVVDNGSNRDGGLCGADYEYRI